MKKKVIGILICMLLIAVSISSVTGTIDENEIYNMKNDDYNNLIKQTFENGVISKNNWFGQDKLVASDGEIGDVFGYSVSVDGDYAIIGAYGDDDNGEMSGSAYIFKSDGTTWTEQAKLLPSDGEERDNFGFSVSISGDYAIIGAYGDDDNGAGSGSAYVFTRDGTSWTQQAKLLASDGAAGDCFGFSVSISGDYAIIGAYGDGDNGYYSGSAYVFKRDGTSWTQQAKLLASDGASSDFFGFSVSISGDYAIIGAYYGDGDNGYYSGSAYVFKRDGTSWVEQAKLLASDGAAYDCFGYSVSISGDYAIIGANGDDDNGETSGSAYVFIRSETSWTEQAKLLASDGEEEDRFGWSVSISGDYAIIGASWDDDNGNDSGSAYVFKRGVHDLSFNIMGGLGAKVVITNNATEDINDVEWEVQVEGGILGMINKTASGTTDIPAEDSVTMGTDILFGLGSIDIKATVAGEEKTAKGTQIIILTLVG